MQSKRVLEKSFEYWKKAEKIIPCGTQTLSKGPNQHVKGVYPIYLRGGKGSHVFDVDGNEYIDYPMALGPVILGYVYPPVDDAITKQLKEGITFSLMHPLEVELAELIIECVPCAEMVRYSKTGSEATSAAIRLSRAYIGREKIAFCGYHGWHDWYAVSTIRNKGIPPSQKDFLYPFEYNKIETLEKIFEENKGEIAAVIMEPIGVEEPKDNFLQRVEDLIHKNGSLLIFDEIITGFRLALGGAQEYFGVTPDMACFGKGIANGMPLSVVAGKKDIMKECEEVFFSTTFGGETLSLAAAIATIDEIRAKDVISHLWKQGEKFKNGYNKLAQEIDVETECIGLPPRRLLTFKDREGKDSLEMKSLFWQETVKRGVLFGNAQFVSYSHTDEDIKKTLLACEQSLYILKKAVDEDRVLDMLEGEVTQEVFRNP